MGTRAAGSKHIHTFHDNYIESDKTADSLLREPLVRDAELYYLRINSPGSKDIFSVRPGSNFDNRANCSFLARLYKPATKAHHAVIIYNGLDETIFTRNRDHHFKFYDDLGAQLARANILALLLPTPYHMNRALVYLDPEKEAERRKHGNFIDFTIPTEALMEHNSNIYRNHFQGFKETVEVCRLLRPDLGARAWLALEPYHDALPAAAAKFLQAAVSPQVKISLLGYSLGGLRALTEYLFDRHDARVLKREPLFTACVAVNSGGALSVLAPPPWVNASRWKSMIEDLLAEKFTEYQPQIKSRGLPRSQHKLAERYYTILNDVFLGQAASLNSLGAAAARDAAKGMLFVVGGGDDLVPLASVMRFAPKGGVTIFQVAGMGHLFPYDPAWRLWKGVVLDVIAKFLDNTARTREEEANFDSLADMICFVDHNLGILPYQSNLEDRETLRQARERIARANHGARSVLGNALQRIMVLTKLEEAEIDKQFQTFAAEALVGRLFLEVQGGMVPPGLYKQRRRALLLGHYLTGGHARLQDAWDHLQRKPDERIGEALVRMGVVRSKDRDAAVVEQRKCFDAIRELMAQEFLSYLRSNRPGFVRARRSVPLGRQPASA